MQNTKKILGTTLVLAVLAVFTLSFQNCAPSSGETPSINSPSVTDSGSDLGVLKYPDSGTPVTLIPGQSITLKLTKPSYMADASQYIWLIPSDDYSLASYYGLFTEIGNSIYVSLTVRPSYASARSMRLYILKIADYTYADNTGLGIRIDPSAYGQHSSADHAVEMCETRGSYVPTFLYDNTNSTADALIIFDNGAGVGALECEFGGASVDCLQTSQWPANWASLPLKVTGYNRCGAGSTRNF